MGGHLSHDPLNTPSKSTIKFLRRINLTDIFECYGYFRKMYFPENMLPLEQFDDIFSPVLNDTEIFFDKLKVKELANFYEALTAMALFSKGEFESKIKSLFKMYDLDGNNSIDKDELKNFLQSGVYGLSRLLNLPVPFEEEIFHLVITCFKDMDKSRSDTIDMEEFSQWIRNSDEIQDFLLRYTGQQTMDRAKKRFNILVSEFKQVIQDLPFFTDLLLLLAGV